MNQFARFRRFAAATLVVLVLGGVAFAVDLSVTATQVLQGSSQPTASRLAGETMTAGQVVYLKAADNRYWLAQADGTAAEAAAVGIALNGAGAGQPVKIQTSGTITIGAGASMTVGEIYILSDTAGGIVPEADISTQDEYVTILGVATTAAILNMQIHASGAQIP